MNDIQVANVLKEETKITKAMLLLTNYSGEVAYDKQPHEDVRL